MSAEQIVEEARRIQESDLERAKSALQAANACGNFDGVCYRIARVELDCDPPLPMVVDVRSSELDGPRLPKPPEADVDIYSPPEERGASSPAFRDLRAADPRDQVSLDEAVAAGAAVIEIGEHRFPTDGSLCEDCGASLARAVIRPRCGA